MWVDSAVQSEVTYECTNMHIHMTKKFKCLIKKVISVKTNMDNIFMGL